MPSAVATTTSARRYAELMLEFQTDPAGFSEVFLGRHLWSRQAELAQAVADYPIVCCAGGRGIGKSYALASIVLWYLLTRPGSKVIATGAGHKNICTVLMTEVRSAWRTAVERAASCGVELGGTITAGYSSPQRLTLDDRGWGLIAYAAETSESFSGVHGDVLCVVDEASALSDEIMTAIRGNDPRRLLLTGNPIRTRGVFADTFRSGESGAVPHVRAIRISSLESPHAHLESSPWGLASRSLLDKERLGHGEHSAWWRSNVLALFPTEESERLIDARWVDRCVEAGVPELPEWLEADPGETWMGVDPAGGVGADRSVIVVRDSREILEIFASADHGVLDDARQRLEPVIAALARKYEVPGSRVVYDQSGVGRNLGSYLAKHGVHGAVGYFGSGGGGKYYSRRRTACAAALKRRLDPHRAGYVPLYCDPTELWYSLREEILELRMEQVHEDGTIKQALESKEAMQKRLRRSPDVLDALLMTFAFAPV